MRKCSLTKPESLFAEKLDQLGFCLKFHDDRSESDPPNIVYMQQQLGKYVFDFAMPCLKVLFEIDGEYWHPSHFRLTATQAQRGIADKEKSDFAKNNGWSVIHIDANKLTSDKTTESIRSLFFSRLESDGV